VQQEIFTTQLPAFERIEPISAQLPLGTKSNPFLVNGSEWRRKRDASIFVDERFGPWLDESFPRALEYLDRRLSPGSPPEAGKAMEAWLHRFLFDFISFLQLGKEVSDRDYSDFFWLMRITDLRMKSNVDVLPPNFHQVRDRWFDTIRAIFEEARHEGAGNAMVDLMARRSRLSDAAIVSELANGYPGGSFSGCATLAYTMSFLSQNSQIRQRLREELSDLASSARPPRYADLENTQLEPVLRETLRLMPPVPLTTRSVRAEAVEVGSVRLYKGTRVALGFGPLMRDPLHWPNPQAWDPNRWTKEVLAANPYGSDYFFPFGRGPRECVGRSMALFFIRTALYFLLSRPDYVFEISPAQKDIYFFGCMLPKGMQGYVRKRA
jgi:cytochrome P450